MVTKSCGKNNNSRPSRCFLDICLSLLGRPYRLGGQMGDDDNALDCLGLVREYTYKMSGTELPMEFEGKDVGVYYELFLDNPGHWSSRLKDYLYTHIPYEYDTNKTLATDILFLRNLDNSGTYACGINTGNGSAIVANKELGVTSINLSTFCIEAHFKCPQQSL